MSSGWREFEAKSVSDALAAAAESFGKSTEELEIEILSEGARGLFGLGGEPAVVRARPASSAPDYTSAFQTVTDGTGVALSPPPTVPPGRTDRESGMQGRLADAPTPSKRSSEPTNEGQQASDPPATENTCSDVDRETAGQVASAVVSEILRGLGVDAQVRSVTDGDCVRIEIEGEELGPVIGKGGNTLVAVQELARAAVQRKITTRCPLVVDAAGYWSRRRGGDDRPRTQ